GLRVTTLGVVLVAWFPLLLLSGLEHRVYSGVRSFVSDYAVHARVLVMLPALLLGRSVADRLFGRAMNFLVEARAVTAESRAQFDRLLGQFGRLRDSWLSIMFIAAGTLALTWIEFHLPASDDLSWKYNSG